MYNNICESCREGRHERRRAHQGGVHGHRDQVRGQQHLRQAWSSLLFLFILRIRRIKEENNETVVYSKNCEELMNPKKNILTISLMTKQQLCH